MKYIIAILVIVTLGYGIYTLINTETPPVVQNEPENQDSVIAYISKNISSLSPEKETVGGTFYVTNITFDRGSGTVDYEDGHNAYTANFTYEFGVSGEVKITDFTLVE